MSRIIPAACSRFMQVFPSPLVRARSASALCVVVIGLTGCGPAPTFVSGVVTLDGSPVEEATLQFYPASGDGQTSHAVTDKAGKFSAKVSPVPLVVTIKKSAPTGEKMQSFPDSPPVDVMEESLLPRYSDRRETELKVTPAEGKTTVAKFSLTSGSK